MKYLFNSQILLIVLFLLSLGACSDNSKEQIDKDILIQESYPDSLLTVSVDIKNKTATSIDLELSASNNNDDYITIVMPTSTYSSIPFDDMLSHIKDQLKRDAENEHKTLEEYIKSIQHKGSYSQNITGLTPYTNYNVVNLLIKKGNIDQTVNSRFTFQTEVANKIDIKFHVDVKDLKSTTGTLSINPQGYNEIGYFICNLPTQVYQQFKTELKVDDEELLTKVFAYQLMGSLQKGTKEEVDEVLENMLLKGPQDHKLEFLKPNTEYTYIIGAFEVPDYMHTTLISQKVYKGTYVTKEKIPFSFTNFDVKVSEDGNSYSVNIVPSDFDTRFMWKHGVLTNRYEKIANKSVKELAETLLKEFVIYPIPPYILKHSSINRPRNPIEFKGEKYYVMAFETDGLDVTSEPVIKIFDTGEQPNPKDLKIETRIEEVLPNTVSITFTPSSQGVHYAFALLESLPTNNIESTKKALQEDIIKSSEVWIKNNKDVDIIDFLDANFYKTEKFNKEFLDLKENTDYSLFIFVINKKGEIVNSIEKKNFVKTKQIAQVGIQPSIYGLYSFKDVSKEMMYNLPYAFKKYAGLDIALVVLKYSFNNGAKEGKSFLLPKSHRENELNPKIISDFNIIDKLYGKFQKITPQEPYGFFLAEWDKPQVCLSVGYDLDKIYGRVNREILLTAKKENVQDIGGLEKLIQEINDSYNSSYSISNNINFKPMDIEGKKYKTIFKESIINQPDKKDFEEVRQRLYYTRPINNLSDLPIFIVVK